jgi:aminoglycoside/choline kinase family phosphotransferase
MIGPALYDLASLCTDRDSARFIDATREAALLERFATALRREGLDLDPATRRRDYFTAAAFRALRVMGRFRHLAVEAGRPAHLRFLPMVAAQARRALEELDDRVLLRALARSAALA